MQIYKNKAYKAKKKASTGSRTDWYGIPKLFCNFESYLF